MKDQTDMNYMHPWPRLRKDKISVSTLSPLRMIILQRLVYDPVVFFLQLWIVFFFVDFLMKLFGYHPLFAFFEYLNPRWMILYILIALFLIGFEISSRFMLSKWLFGQRLKIIFKEENIVIWRGWRKKTFSRRYALSFAWRNFESFQYPIYGKSKKFQIVINDQHSVTLAEVFDLKLIERLVENCNYANLKTLQNQDFDIDPRTQA